MALATDYDGTLATQGRLTPATIAALERCRASGRHVILVTGRELDDLSRVCPDLSWFSRVVAENGALLYEPSSRRERLLGEGVPDDLVRVLQDRGVTPLSVGRVIVATREPHEVEVLRAIRDLGLEREVIFNKGAVMVLPSGVNKATGLAAALEELGLSPHNVVAVGDAENDHAFLSLAECGVAVAGALPALKERADLVTQADEGAGVVELIDRLVADDLRSADDVLSRHDVAIGVRGDGREVRVRPQRQSVLVAGPSGAGKSKLATVLIERLMAASYQVCVIDPEGDYSDAFDAIRLGDATHAPSVEAVRTALARPTVHCVLNLLAIHDDDRPAFAATLWPVFAELRARVGRPHWILVDEAHHVLPAGLGSVGHALPARLEGMGFVTLSPSGLATEVLQSVDVVVGVGREGAGVVESFGDAVGEPVPGPSNKPPAAPKADSVIAAVWERRDGTSGVSGSVEWFTRASPEAEHRRHVRKYAEGTLSPELSFYFRGPSAALNLQATNLSTFVQLASGVDDATWQYHLERGDYARWFREAIKDEALADGAERVARDAGLTPGESRSRIKADIEQRYAKGTEPAM